MRASLMVVSAAFLLASPGAVAGQEQEAAGGQSERAYVESSSLFPILVQLPDDYDPEGPRPKVRCSNDG